MEIEFTHTRIDREPIPIEPKPSKPEVLGSNPGGPAFSFKYPDKFYGVVLRGSRPRGEGVNYLAIYLVKS